jgi:hypothetical protein
MVRRQRVGNRGPPSGRCIAACLTHRAIELRQGRGHARIPAGLIAGLRQLFQQNAGALGGHGHAAKTARKRFVLRDRDGVTGHGLGQACGFVLAVGAHRFCNPAIHPRLSALGGRDKAVKARQGEQETHQAHATRPAFDADERDGNHYPRSESEAGTFLKELGDLGV